MARRESRVSSRAGARNSGLRVCSPGSPPWCFSSQLIAQTMSTLQLIHLIEQDLRALSNEARRRFADVKDAAERAMVALRSVQAKLPPSASPAEQGAAVAASQDVLMPFMLALASKSDTLPQMALGAVQRMISHNAVAPQRLAVHQERRTAESAFQ